MKTSRLLYSVFSLFLCSLASLLWGISPAIAGVVVGGTRVVYHAEKGESSISVSNPEKKRPYLIQSWVEDVNGKKEQRFFVVTPPLFRLNAGQENILRIIRTEGILPQDRESVFWLNIKAIPSSEEGSGNNLLISVKTRMKLFYRPEGLEGRPNEAYRQLVFSNEGNVLTVHNPTAYHVSFQTLSVDGNEIKTAGMVAPKGKLSWDMHSAGAKRVTWKAINDYGAATTESQVEL
ncbi:molecular chaperone [Shewanella algae]|uniref:fimbrial biogenesis chaperone n=1 Tax=Shewanella algae TaxID=38313 RepID=UPI001AACFBAD|nr:molecular chaperone [Shewanella algae]MBO2675582.1 molecular chaperone [Shewanella algae]